MRKILLVAAALFLLFVYRSDAQNYLMGNSNVSTCAGNFRDSGGNGVFGDYSNGENYTMTFCSNAAGQCIRMNFTAFNVEDGYDFLTIYNGPNTASPLIGVYTGTNSPGTVTGTSGCLTFVFTSDVIVTSTGWNAAISCVACAAGGGCTATCNGGAPPANDACSGAQNLGALPAPANCPNGIGAWLNTQTTNLCATAESPYTTLTGCNPSGNMASPASDVWYRFTITGPTLNVSVSGGLQTPNVGLYSGSGCNNLVGRGCEIGAGGILNASFGGLAAGTYFLQVSGGNLNDQCDFTLSLQNNYDCAGCVIQSSLTVNPPPLNGTYQAGQLVNFCYTISDYNQTSVNWLHAVVPTFGAGWDMPTLTTVMPANCSGNGTWGWYNTNVTSTATGAVHGPGFYYDSPLGDGNGGYPDGNPGDNFGDNNPANTCDWTFCFSIRTKPVAQCVQGASLNVAIDTYGDGESGSWTSLACVGDPITEAFATLVCCQPPVVNTVDPVCPGQNGSATAAGQGTGPWDYVWQNGAGTTIQTVNNLNGADAMNSLPSGNYTVSATDNSGCTSITNFTIATIPNLVVFVNASPTKCNRNDGNINVIANGGTAPLQYSNNNGASYQAGSTFGNLAPGNYTVIVRDANGCTVSQAVNIAPSVIPVINSTPVVSVSCNGGSNGSITVNAGSGNPPFQYSIDGGVTFQASNSFPNLTAGAYAVVVSDVDGCTATANVNVPQPAVINITGIVPVQATCGSNNGSLTITAAGGTGALQYSITGGAPYQVSNVFNGLPAGNYNVVVTDANGCTATANPAISNSAAPVINSAPVVQLLCNGGTNASITVNASGGTGALSYSNNNGTTFQAGNVFGGLSAGNYDLVVRDASGCLVNLNVVIADPPAIVVATVPAGAVCTQANGSLTINANGGTGALQYSINNGATYQAGNTFNSLAPGNYNIVVRDANGCTSPAVVNVPDSPPPVIVSVTPTNIDCNGANNGAILITDNGGTAPIEYSINNGATYQVGNSFSGLAPGNYQVSIRDANGCTATSNVNIAQPAALAVNPVPANATCSQPNGSIILNANGGTAPYQYSVDGGATFQAGNSFNGLAAGNYSVVVTDANGCIINSGASVADTPGPRIDATAIVNVDCFGSNNGSIQVTASNGTAPLQYSNNNGATFQAGNNFTGLAPGAYTIVVRDANGCVATVVDNITQPTQVVITGTPTVDVLCNGAGTGSITINANGGTGALQYSITGGAPFQAANTFNNLPQGGYTATVVDANGCQQTTPVNIAEPTAVVITGTPAVDVDCNGASNGTITINANGGTAPLQYSINNGATFQVGNNFNGLAPANYQIVVQDANGCQQTTAVAIAEPTAVVIAGTPTVDVNCNGANNGTITINANGGTAPLQYSINNGATFQAGNNFNNLVPANYQIVVQDANGCLQTAAVSIVEPTAVVITGTPSVDVDCNGANNGSLVINANGGTAPLQYSINNGATFQAVNNFNNLAPANYQIVVQDANGCQQTAAVNIIEPTAVVIAGTPSVNVDCNGANNGSIVINANGGTAPLQYSINNGATFQAGNNFNNLAPANYQVMVQDANGCQQTAAVNIIEPTAVVITGTPTVDVNCNGANNGTITINANGGTAPLQYSIDNGATFQAGNNFNNLSPANYQVVVQDANGCRQTAAASIVQPTAVVITGTPTVDVDCNGANNGTITINANGGTAPFQYSIDNGTTFQAGNNFNNLAPANYQIVVQDANGCQQTAAASIIEPTAVVIAGTPSVNVDCNGANNGSIVINANGGTAPLQYSINNGGTFQAGNNFNNLAPANYQIVVQDANGCQQTTAVNIIEPTVVVITGTPTVDVDCNGANNGTITINANGGTAPLQYSINNGATYQAGNNFNGLAPANYQIVVQDANGCQQTAAASIVEPAAVVITGTPAVDVDCNGANNGTITINANGGTAPLQYSINNGATFQAGNNFNNLSPANYQVVVQDANGCRQTAAASIAEPSAVVIAGTPSVHVDCNGANNGAITINANGGTAPLQYSINNGTTFQAGNNFSNLAPANYQIVVQDANGCLQTAAVNIMEPTALALNTNVTDANCGNANGAVTINANGGTAPYQYSINNGATFQASNNFPGLLSNNYNIVVQDANGCLLNGNAAVNNLAAPVINTTPSVNILCNGGNNGSITINANGGTGALQYSIDGGTTFSANNTFNNLVAGNYNIVVSDAAGCQAAIAVQIIEPAVLAMASNVVGTTCSNANGSIAINANGGTAPYQYSSNNGSSYQASANFNNIPAGNYQLVVLDANGCVLNANANVADAPAPVINNVAVADLTCNGSNDGTITITSAGGTAPVRYSIDNGVTFQAANQFSNLPIGNYQVVVTDANGCDVNSAANIIQPAAIVVNSNSVNANCGQADGSLTIAANGGTGTLQYSINGGVTFQTSASFNNIVSGNYNIVVQDANGCTQAAAGVVNSNAAPAITNVAAVDIDCNGANNGTITITANGGTGALQYSINNGATYQASGIFNNLPPGNYTIAVMDAVGCIVNNAAVIVEPSVLVANANPVTSTCGNANGSIAVNAIGGTAPYQYSNNNGASFQAGSQFNNLAANNYLVVVQDANGCTSALNANVAGAPAAVINNVAANDISCNGLADGTIAITTAGGTPPLQFSIDNGLTYQAASSFNNLGAGNYQVVVQDANGCLTNSSAVIVQPAAIVLNSNTVNSNCNQADGSLSVVANGGTGVLQYSIDNGVSFQSSSTFGFLNAGNYNVIVQDANGCTNSIAVVVNNNAAPAITNVLPVDITCNGANNGSITITANGGTGALQYSINNGSTFQAGNVFSNLSPGNYAVVVQDGSGCDVTSAAVIVEPALLVANSNTVTSTCGNPNGSIAVNANGGTAPLQYSNDNGSTFQAGNQFANLAAGNYQVVVTDANGCQAQLNAVVAGAPSPVINNVVANDVSCNGLTDGSIVIASAGGTAPIQYSIDNGITFQAGNQFLNIPVGNYQVVVSDANGCLSNSNAVIAQPAAIVLNSNSSNSNCNQADGSITVNANGGTGALQYSIDNGVSFQPGGIFSFIPAGNYNIIVQDANGCTNSVAVVVNNNAAPAISNVAAVDITCNGSNNGSVTITANGGTGALQYSINNGSTFQAANVFSNLSPGNYAVVVQDATGCDVTSNAIVAEPALLVLNSNTTISTCGIANGSIVINANGGTAPLQYSNDNGATFQPAGTFNGLATGNYQLVVTDANGCSVSANANVASAPSPVINNVAATDLSCNGSNDGTIGIAITGGTAPLQFSIDNGATFQAQNNFSGLANGNYQVMVQDANGCTGTSNAVINQPAAIVYNVVVNDATCGSSNGTLTINANGGAGSLSYSINGGTSFQSGNVFNNLVANNYNIVVQDANGCDVNGVSAVANTAAPVISSMPLNDASCNGLSDGSIVINVTGGNGALTYSINGGITTQASNTFNNLPAGNYSIVVTDATGCTVTSPAVITEPSPINVNVNTTTATCGVANGTVTVVANGGAGVLQYSINNGASFQANGSFNGQSAGNYNVVVQDGNGCEATIVASVQNTNAPVIASAPFTDITCNGANNGSIVINANGGTAPLQFSIDNGVTYQAGNTFNNLPQSTYQVSVVDAVGCLATSSVTINEPAAIIFNSVPVDASCGNANGQLTINALGGTPPLQYSNNNGTTFQASSQFNALPASNYNVVVQDANGCNVNAIAVIANLAGPAISSALATDVTCNGNNDGVINVSANGGTGVLQFSIDNGVTFQSGNIFNNVGPGNYQVVVQDANGCSAAGAAAVVQPSALVLNANPTGSTCSDANGQLALAANGGTTPYLYSIDNGISFQPGANFNNLPAGNYSIVVQDGNGCETSSAINVVDAPAPVIANTVPTDVTCYGLNNGAINITVNGGTAPLQYSVNNGSSYQPASSFANLSIGNYAVVVQDANGCTANAAALIAQPQQINYIVATVASTCGNANGAISVNNVTGGTGVYQYSIDNGATFQALNQFANLGSGNYQVLVQDANGCNIPNAAVINNIAGPAVSAVNVTDVLCNGDNNGTISVTQSGGTGPFQFSINNGTTFQGGSLFNGLAIGNYQVVVQDANGCSATGVAAIAQPAALLLNANTTGSTCSNANGALALGANGGISPYQYSINNGITFLPSGSFNNLLAGNYQVVVQDANGCETASAASIIDAPAPAILTSVPADVTCYGLSNGGITINASGGTAPLQYSIDNGSTFQSGNQFSNLGIGNFQVVVQDANGCTSSSAALVSQPQQINYIVAAAAATCGNANGTITINNTTGGTGAYQYSINNGVAFQAANQFANLSSGNYAILVQDANGCNIPNAAVINNIAGPVVSLVGINDVDCYGNSTGAISVTPQGGTGPFQYSVNNGTSYQGGNIFNGLIAGNYHVMIQDANGCLADSLVSIAQPALLNYNVASAVATCGNANGNLVLNATGGSGNYIFSIDSGLTFQLSGTFGNLSTGNYTVVVQDANNCAASGPVSILNAPSPVVSLTGTNDATCFGLNNGSLTVSSVNGTSPFTYSINGGSGQSSSIFSNLLAGNYSIIVSDNNGCTDTVLAVISQPTQVVLQAAATHVLCNGGNTGSANVIANGGVSPYSYQWSGGAGTNPAAANLVSATYTVTVTDANNCAENASITVNQPAALAPAAASANVTCFGLSNGWASMQVGGGTAPYQYAWSSSPATGSTANNLPAGNYTLTVTDANGCTLLQSYSISQPTQIVANANASAVSCFGGSNGSVTVNATGGAGPYNYSINGGSSQSLNQFSNLTAGNYSVTLTDMNGCTALAATVVSQPTQLVSNTNAVNILCFGQTNGTVAVNASGGTPPYNYVWSGGLSGSQIQNLGQGTYHVTVTDANGCITSATAVISQPTAIAASVAAVPTICIGQNTSLTASASGGVAPYTFKWNTGFTGNPLAISPAITTIYNVVVNDANGCSAAPVYRTVGVHPALAVVVSPNDTICEGESVSVSATPSGGNGGPYTYSWTGTTSLNNTINVSPILTTSYTVTINDGCTVLPAQSTSTVKVNPLPVITFAPDPEQGCVPLTVNFSNLTVNGVDYKWQFGDGNTSPDVTPTHIYTQPGVYDVTLEATSSEGCYKMFVMDDAVHVFDNPVAGFTADPPRTTILHPVIQFKDMSIGADRWEWSFGDPFGFSTDQHPEYTYRDTGRYAVSLVVMNNDLCSDTTYGEVIIDGDVSVYIPNAFSPNNDGKNEVFNVYSIGISSANLTIFDRWGNLIHTHHNATPHWDGKNQLDNRMCQQGVYVYVLKARDIFGKDHSYKGTVTLLR